MAAHAVQGAAGLGEQGARVHRVRLGGVAREGGVRLGGGGGEGVGVAEALGLGGELGVLARDRLGGGDLVQPEAEQVRLLGALAGPGGQLLQRRGDLPQRAVDPPVAGQRPGDGLARVAVQRAALAGGAQQALLVGLAVHGDQLLAEFGEQPDRHGPAADVGARAPLGGDRPADQQRTVVQLGPRLQGAGGRRGPGGQPDPPLHHGPVGAAPHQPGVGPATEQQPEAGHHHGLARTCFARHRCEARCQFDHRVIDDAKIPYPHLVQHGDDLTRFHPHRATSPGPERASSSLPVQLRHCAPPHEELCQRPDRERVGDRPDPRRAAQQDSDHQHRQLDTGADQPQ